MQESALKLPEEGRNRVVIARVEPEVDGGRFAVKRCVGDTILLRAEAFCDGHDRPSCAVKWRHQADSRAAQKLMDDQGWDWWQASCPLERVGTYYFEVLGWVDHFRTWREDLEKRVHAGQDIEVDLQIGARMIRAAATRAGDADAQAEARALLQCAEALQDATLTQLQRASAAIEDRISAGMRVWAERRFVTTYRHVLAVDVEPERARFSSWYEFFPRSSTISAPDSPGETGVHATLKDAKGRLDYAAQMGFNVVYLPPIHPIGRVKRKGPNNATQAGPQDVGSPWAIGASEGGHKSIHPRLGTLEDFRDLVDHARRLQIDIALDIAFQASPDHPWVTEHPEWFRSRPDGSIQYAENPPKKYEDIYPFDFETENWRELWVELESVFRHWCEMGVRVFRVDNPHTKPFGLWEWLIPSIKQDFPETIFLAEAFSRPAVMHRLAKLGFSQSYTYFAWRNTRYELEEYLRELTQTEVVEFMRPNFWPNTPDILTEALQSGKRATFMLRVALAATMSSNYGIYGPAYELMEHVAVRPGSEEYLGSEKYQLRHWDLEHPDSLKEFIGRLNRIRQQNPALQQMRSTTIHGSEDDQIFAFSKYTEARDNVILVVANLNADETRATMVNLDLGALGVDADQPFHIHDLVDDARYVWQGPRNYVELNPRRCPIHIFRVGERPRDERDFDYYH